METYERKKNPLISFANQRAFQVFDDVKKQDMRMIDRFESSVLELNDPVWQAQYQRVLRVISQKWAVPDEDRVLNDVIVDNFISSQRRRGPGLLGRKKDI